MDFQSKTLSACRVATLAIRCCVRARPVVDLLLGLFLRHSVSLLNAPDQLVFLAGDHAPVAIGQFPPALARGAGKLLPFAFDLVPIHIFSYQRFIPDRVAAPAKKQRYPSNINASSTNRRSPRGCYSGSPRRARAMAP